MKTRVLALALFVLAACGKADSKQPAPAAADPDVLASAQPAKATTPPLDPTNIVSIAIGSPDHTTLVKALQAADYVTAVSNAGPLTVFAPTNAAFDALPAGTLDKLLQPDQLDALKNIVKYHATTSVYDATNLKDGQMLAMSNGAKAEIHIVDGQITINGAHVLKSIRASNGIVHVIDAVLIPPAK